MNPNTRFYPSPDLALVEHFAREVELGNFFLFSKEHLISPPTECAYKLKDGERKGLFCRKECVFSHVFNMLVPSCAEHLSVLETQQCIHIIVPVPRQSGSGVAFQMHRFTFAAFLESNILQNLIRIPINSLVPPAAPAFPEDLKDVEVSPMFCQPPISSSSEMQIPNVPSEQVESIKKLLNSIKCVVQTSIDRAFSQLLTQSVAAAASSQPSFETVIRTGYESFAAHMKDNFDNSLTCSFCLGRQKGRTFIVPCGDTFCESCFAKLYLPLCPCCNKAFDAKKVLIL